MGLYNALFGNNEAAGGLMGLLQHKQSFDVGRFRDAWVEHDGDRPLIRVHTRNGGGNREAYEAENDSMADHPWYVRDQDDEYDSTYADFYFAPPLEELEPDIGRALVTMAQAPVDMGERWNAVIDAIKNS